MGSFVDPFLSSIRHALVMITYRRAQTLKALSWRMAARTDLTPSQYQEPRLRGVPEIIGKVRSI